jgi:hypothetical protein
MISETKQKAELATIEGGAEAELVELINQKIKPNKPLEGKEVFIRRMFLVSDQINSFGGRFDRKELLKMAELAVDAPVLVGHDHQKLPIGRSFSAEIEERNGAVWLAVHFYWLAEAEGAGNLAKNIDGGIYKEVSAAFLFETPECSVCGRDIRSCEHVPFRRYAAPNGSLQPAFFRYRNVSKFLEASLVFRGAVAGTGIAAPMAVQNQEFFATKIVNRRAVQSRRRRPQRIYR